jgi:hypothetical protein
MRIKANELRIGNWVNVTDKDYQVTQILERGVNCGHIGAMYDLVKPIPITTEWLLKFGFKEKSKWTFVLNTPNGRMLTYHLGTKIIHYGSNGYGSGEINCEYVHQLQNLYFALTGEELTIKTIDQWYMMK